MEPSAARPLGTVSKRCDRSYTSGLRKHWVKVKNPNAPEFRGSKNSSPLNSFGTLERGDRSTANQEEEDEPWLSIYDSVIGPAGRRWLSKPGQNFGNAQG